MRNRASKPAKWASKGKSKIMIQEFKKGKEMRNGKERRITFDEICRVTVFFPFFFHRLGSIADAWPAPHASMTVADAVIADIKTG